MLKPDNLRYTKLALSNKSDAIRSYLRKHSGSVSHLLRLLRDEFPDDEC